MGTRPADRIGDERKQRFIDTFIEQKRIDDYPLPLGDVLLRENRLERSFYEKRTLWQALASEIEDACKLFGLAVPHSKVVATELLDSDLPSQDGVLRDMALREISVELVLAHLESLAFELPKELSFAIARRATLCLLNRRLTKEGTGPTRKSSPGEAT